MATPLTAASAPGRSPRGTRFCSAGMLLAGIGVAALLLAGPGHRFGLLATRPALLVFALGNLLVLLAAASSAAGLILSKGTGSASSSFRGWGTLVIALILTANGAIQFAAARSVPPIHDISTDTDQPPRFVAILPLRADAPNSPEYPGASIASAQHSAYPDIRTIELRAPADTVFQTAVRTAKAMGWKLVATDPSSGRIEATDTTFWFGFKDDVIIRIKSTGAGTLVDVRSESRVGMSDVGANAHRIRAFRKRLTAALPN